MFQISSTWMLSINHDWLTTLTDWLIVHYVHVACVSMMFALSSFIQLCRQLWHWDQSESIEALQGGDRESPGNEYSLDLIITILFFRLAYDNWIDLSRDWKTLVHEYLWGLSVAIAAIASSKLTGTFQALLNKVMNIQQLNFCHSPFPLLPAQNNLYNVSINVFFCKF